MGAGPSGTPGPSSSMYRRATVPRSTSCIPARKMVAAAMSAKPMLRVPARTSASPIARQVLEYHVVLQGRWRDDHLSTRPNISESHSDTSTRVPHCITGALEGSGLDGPSHPSAASYPSQRAALEPPKCVLRLTFNEVYTSEDTLRSVFNRAQARCWPCRVQVYPARPRRYTGACLKKCDEARGRH